MSRSFVAGSIAGAVVGLLGFASVSLMGPPSGGDETVTTPEDSVGSEPVAPAPDDTAAATAVTPETQILEVPAGSEFARPQSDDLAQVPGADASPDLNEAPVVAAPAEEPSPALTDMASATPPAGATEAPAAMSEPETEPEAATKIATAEAEADAPLAAVSGAGQAGGNRPVKPTPSIGAGVVLAPAPDTSPAIAPAPVIDEAPVTDAIPTAEVTAAAEVPKTEVATPAPALAPETALETTTPAAEAPAPATSAPDNPAPADTVASEAPDAPPMSEESVPDESLLDDVAADESTADESVADESMADESVADESVVDESVVDDGLPKILELSPQAPQDETSQILPGVPQPGLKRLVPGVKLNRLPSIGTEVASETAPETTTETLPVDTAALPSVVAPSPNGQRGDALTRYAAKFTNPDDKPVLAILLLDIGVAAGGLDANALGGLPFVATIALDPKRPDASADAAKYRAAGSEVAIMVGALPQGATPADLEVAYQSYTQSLPEAVALTGLPTAEFQSNRLMAQHIAQLLANDGRGLVTYEQGLNPGKQAAGKAGTAHASIEKLFGQAEDNSGTLGRELDRAAFEAGQRGSRVVALPTTPEAITGLMAWAASPAAAAVALAPVSAVMIDTNGN